MASGLDTLPFRPPSTHANSLSRYSPSIMTCASEMNRPNLSDRKRWTAMRSLNSNPEVAKPCHFVSKTSPSMDNAILEDGSLVDSHTVTPNSIVSVKSNGTRMTLNNFFCIFEAVFLQHPVPLLARDVVRDNLHKICFSTSPTCSPPLFPKATHKQTQDKNFPKDQMPSLHPFEVQHCPNMITTVAECSLLESQHDNHKLTLCPDNNIDFEETLEISSNHSTVSDLKESNGKPLLEMWLSRELIKDSNSSESRDSHHKLMDRSSTSGSCVEFLEEESGLVASIHETDCHDQSNLGSEYRNSDSADSDLDTKEATLNEVTSTPPCKSNTLPLTLCAPKIPFKKLVSDESGYYENCISEAPTSPGLCDLGEEVCDYFVCSYDDECCYDNEWDEEDESDDEFQEDCNLNESADALWKSFEDCMFSPQLHNSPSFTKPPSRKHKQDDDLNPRCVMMQSGNEPAEQSSQQEFKEPTASLHHKHSCHHYSDLDVSVSITADQTPNEPTDSSHCKHSCQHDSNSSVDDLSMPVTNKKRGVNFPDDSKLTVIHTIVAWEFAYRAARKGPWEQFARDRAHFRRRIELLAPTLEPCLAKKVASFS